MPASAEPLREYEQKRALERWDEERERWVPPDTPDIQTIEAELEDCKSEAARYRAALEPFARMSDYCNRLGIIEISYVDVRKLHAAATALGGEDRT